MIFLSIRKDRPAVLKSTRDIEYSIFKRRRLRSSKACYPCRRRKVKCGLGKPCNTCSSRGHPDLCDYTAQIPSTGVEAGNSDTQGTAPQEDGLSRFDRNPGLYVDPLVPYTSKLHIGSDSLPRLLSNYQRLNPCRPKNTSAITATGVESNSQTIFEVLCLQDSSTSFQFTNLWQPGDGLELVYNALPEDEVILK